MARRNSRKNGKIWLDLNQIDNFAYALRKNKETVAQKLREVCDRWGTMTKSDYENRISYAGGFGSRGQRGKRAFYSVEIARSVENGIHVSVGHESFIAKFLEVGTQPHEIIHKDRNGKNPVVATVSGIKGSKALSKAYTEKRKILSQMIESEINKLIIGGV